MVLQVERHLFSLEEYERMVEAGVFNEDAHIELIRGEIVEMAPINFPHQECVARLTTLLVTRTVGRGYVWPQNNSIRLPGHSEPQPDLVLLRWRDDMYAGRPPTVADVLLVVEVSDSSLKYDREVKGPLYAGAGIPEYWIVNLRDQVIEVYAQPAGDTYQHTQQARSGDQLTLSAVPQSALAVTDILGPPRVP